jgi:hypothetical protein
MERTARANGAGGTKEEVMTHTIRTGTAALAALLFLAFASAPSAAQTGRASGTSTGRIGTSTKSTATRAPATRGTSTGRTARSADTKGTASGGRSVGIASGTRSTGTATGNRSTGIASTTRGSANVRGAGSSGAVRVLSDPRGRRNDDGQGRNEPDRDGHIGTSNDGRSGVYTGTATGVSRSGRTIATRPNGYYGGDRGGRTIYGGHSIPPRSSGIIIGASYNRGYYSPYFTGRRYPWFPIACPWGGVGVAVGGSGVYVAGGYGRSYGRGCSAMPIAFGVPYFGFFPTIVAVEPQVIVERSYDSYDDDVTVVTPRRGAERCAVVTVLDAAGEGFWKLVALPALGAYTPDELADRIEGRMTQQTDFAITGADGAAFAVPASADRVIVEGCD